MIKTTYQTPELRNANDEVVQEGAFGKNTALSNSTNDGWIDYVMNDLEALHDTIGDSAPTLDGNGHVVEPANLAIGDEDGVRLKTGYLKTSGGTVSGTLNIAQNLKLQDNQENVFGGFYVPASSATSQFLQIYGGETPSNNGGNLQLPSDGSWTLQAKNGNTAYNLVGGTDGTLKWRGNNVAVTASPAFTGSPTAPTQAVNNSSTRLATTAYVVNDLKANALLTDDALATTIQQGDDLNDYKTPGTYVSKSAGVTSSLSNCPVTNICFKLIVLPIGYANMGYGAQILITSAARIYVRNTTSALADATWRDWNRIALAENVLPLTGGTLTASLTTQGDYYKNFRNLTRGELPSTNSETIVIAGRDVTNTLCNYISEYVSTSGVTSLRFVLYAWTQENSNIYFALENESGNHRFRPSVDNAINLGMSSSRWKQLYAATTTISTSDERLKDNIQSIPAEVLDAWGEVNWYQYQFKDSIEEKGETKARLHTGAIAQRIESVFESHGLDANKYGLLCYDEWKSEPAERDENGSLIRPAQPAGNRYSLRYEEALCMEAAYQRRRADRLEQRLNDIEHRLSALETL